MIDLKAKAREMAKAVILVPPYSQKTGSEWTEAIEAAILKGMELMAEEVQPIPIPDWSGPQNRNFRRRMRYHERKILEAIEACCGVAENKESPHVQ